MMITYNHARYIKKAIESVLQQKVDFEFELVIGEDCSTDGTREIVYDYANRYKNKIKLITSEKNVGMKKNSLRTYKVLRGQYIAWCEGDDFWQSRNKLQKQVDYLESHPECGLVYSDYNKQYIKNNEIIYDFLKNNREKYINEPNVENILLGKTKILTCTVVARRKLVAALIRDDPYLYTNDTFLMGDTQLWAEISLKSEITMIEESLATHCVLPESATQSKDIKKVLKFWISNSEMCIYLCEKHSLNEKIMEIHENISNRLMLRLAYYENDKELAEIARKKIKKMRIKDFVWYYTVKNDVLRIICSPLGALYTTIRK